MHDPARIPSIDLFEEFPLPGYLWRVRDLENTEFMAFNRAAYSVSNGEIAQFVGALYPHVYREDRSIFRDFERCARDRESFTRELDYAWYDGSTRRLRATYLYGGGSSVYVFTEDITEATENLARLEESQKRLADAQRIAGMGSWAFYIDEERLEVTEAFNAIFGFASEASPNIADVVSAVAEADRDRFFAVVEEALGGRPAKEFTYRVCTPDGQHKTLRDRLALSKSLSGAHLLVGAVLDVTQDLAHSAALERELQRREVLLREVHHRVKNGLQVVTSLLDLEAAHCPSSALTRARSKVETLGALHTCLYGSPTVECIEATNYLGRVANAVARAYGHLSVELNVSITPRSLRHEVALSLGLIAHEMLARAYEHNQVKGEPKRIELHGTAGPNEFSLRLEELSTENREIDHDAQSMLSDMLVSLTEQLGGTLSVGKTDSGFELKVTVPVDTECAPSAILVE